MPLVLLAVVVFLLVCAMASAGLSRLATREHEHAQDQQLRDAHRDPAVAPLPGSVAR